MTSDVAKGGVKQPEGNSPPDAEPVPADQVQGIILHGYELLRSARYVLLHIPDGKADAARLWLAGLLESKQITDASAKPREQAVNLAFTFAGLEKLGLAREAFLGFSREFREGMDCGDRPRILGDSGRHGPDFWEWGGKKDPRPIHALLMLYARWNENALQELIDEKPLEELWQRHRDLLVGHGLEIVHTLDTKFLPNRREHFAFRDGIAQPSIRGYTGKDPPPREEDLLAAGEILLGFTNEYGKQPATPSLPGPDINSRPNFGYCGSYMVFRQLEQDVLGFWRYLAREVERRNLSPDDLEKLGAKMVGRWRSGAPLALAPDRDDPNLVDADTFGYEQDKDPPGVLDALGARVPLGCHIRRTNPRDSLEPGPGGRGRLTREASLKVTRLHRLIRRGRAYGEPLAASMDPIDILKVDASQGEEGKRGLHFICFNANIARQFEFVQQTWSNNPKFGGLYGDADPLTGTRPGGDVFTAQGNPVRARYLGLPEFVTMKGGAYFFMPGLEALKHLAGLPHNLKKTDPAAVAVDPREFAGEYPPPGEKEHIEQLTELLRQKVERDYAGTKPVGRDAHAKHQGVVRAEFIVEPDLPSNLRVGVFREPGKKYPAWIRFSNQEGTPQPDYKKDIRGMAIKLMGVEGEKLLEDEKHERTQDFLLISTPVFVTRDVAEFHALIRAMVRGFWSMAWFFFNPFNAHLRVFSNLRRSMTRHANPLEIRYWSTTPYLFGPCQGEYRAVKYSAKPSLPASAIPRNPSDDYLREAMKQTLDRQEVLFDFLVQFQKDPYRTPIEDPGAEWSERLSPFEKVATIRIPAQQFDSAEQMAFGEHLSFTPWHSLPEHRPLGGINRARKVAYQTISKYRHLRNDVPRQEPTPES